MTPTCSGARRPGSPPPFLKLNLWRRTVKSRRPGRVQNEGSAEPERLTTAIERIWRILDSRGQDSGLGFHVIVLQIFSSCSRFAWKLLTLTARPYFSYFYVRTELLPPNSQGHLCSLAWLPRVTFQRVDEPLSSEKGTTQTDLMSFS